jgi:RNA polymerase sigma factor (sigma-70 family)
MGPPRHLPLAGTSRVFGISHHRRDEFDRAALVHVPELLRVAARLCGDAAAGEDLVQETYLQAWRSFHRFEAGTNCRAWLYKILLFTYSAQRRKRARQPFLVDIDTANDAALLVEPPTPDMLTAEAVRAAFDRLRRPHLPRSGRRVERADWHGDVSSQSRAPPAPARTGGACARCGQRSRRLSACERH